jgi:hypothetical protein
MASFSSSPLFRPLVLGALLAGGCGQGNGPGNLVPVRGKVILDDQPLTSGSVSFRP